MGRKLLENCAFRAKAAGVNKLYLEVRESNLAARALYEAVGFVTDGTRPGFYQDPREDAKIMHWDLESAHEKIRNENGKTEGM